MDFSHRKVSKVLKITNGNNEPLCNEKVHIALKNHEFLFGCGAFETIPYVMEKNPQFGEKVPENLIKNLALKPDIEAGIEKWLNLLTTEHFLFTGDSMRRKRANPTKQCLWRLPSFCRAIM